MDHSYTVGRNITIQKTWMLFLVTPPPPPWPMTYLPHWKSLIDKWMNSLFSVACFLPNGAAQRIIRGRHLHGFKSDLLFTFFLYFHRQEGKTLFPNPQSVCKANTLLFHKKYLKENCWKDINLCTYIFLELCMSLSSYCLMAWASEATSKL